MAGDFQKAGSAMTEIRLQEWFDSFVRISESTEGTRDGVLFRYRTQKNCCFHGRNLSLYTYRISRYNGKGFRGKNPVEWLF